MNELLRDLSRNYPEPFWIFLFSLLGSVLLLVLVGAWHVTHYIDQERLADVVRAGHHEEANAMRRNAW